MAKNSKAWYQSKTIQGSIVSALGLLVLVLDLPISNAEIADIVGQLGVLVGTLGSVYGRIATDGSKITK